MIKRILLKLKVLWLLNHSNETKIKYYRSLGVKIGDGCRFTGKPLWGSEPYLIEIGNDCLITQCTFHTHDGGVKVLNTLNFFQGKSMDKVGRIRVGNNCFIGSGVRIMPGITIGDNCILGAGSIISKNVPSNSVVAGIPAKIICTIEEYYKKNLQRGNFYATGSLSKNDKRKILSENVKNFE